MTIVLQALARAAPPFALRGVQHDVLDRIAVGIILLDRSGQVVHANRAASRLAAEGRPVRIARRNLVAAMPRNDKRLSALIRSALQGAPPAAIGISAPEDGKLVTVLAMPMRERDREWLNGLDVGDVAAIVFLSDPTFVPEIPVKWVMDAFGLTPAEARVALSTAGGASVPETAAQCGGSRNTVKTHLRRVFAKTGVGRQSELANLFAGLRLLAHEPD
jgi:DNA-binding CsgD family transcriptional regulator